MVDPLSYEEPQSPRTIHTRRDGPLYAIPISRWKALSLLLAAEMEDALNEPDGHRHTANAIAQLVARA